MIDDHGLTTYTCVYCLRPIVGRPCERGVAGVRCMYHHECFVAAERVEARKGDRNGEQVRQCPPERKDGA